MNESVRTLRIEHLDGDTLSLMGCGIGVTARVEETQAASRASMCCLLYIFNLDTNSIYHTMHFLIGELNKAVFFHTELAKKEVWDI